MGKWERIYDFILAADKDIMAVMPKTRYFELYVHIYQIKHRYKYGNKLTF